VNPGRRGASPGDFLWWVLRAQWACGLVLLALLTEVSRAAVLASGASFLGGVALDRAGASRAGLRRLTLPLVVLAAAGSGADFFLGSRDPLFAVSVLVLGVQSIKFLLPKSARDGWQLCAVSFLEFLAAAATTEEIQFVAFAFLYLGLCAGAMWALQIEQREEERPGTLCRVRPRFAAKLLLFSMAGGFLLTAVLFALTPRIGIGQILRRLGRGGGLTGFSDAISLRDITGVKLDRTVVARVEFPELRPGASPLSLYLRGAVYSRFDGTTWKRPGGDRRRVPRSGFHYLVAPPARGGRISTAEITLEAMESPALFVYGNPFLLEGSLGEIWMEEGGSLSLSQPGHAALRYRLQFFPDAQRGPRSGAPKEPEYLELPPGWDDVRGLAARVSAGGTSDASIAELALRHFRTGYRYTIVDPAPSVREFLFTNRAGFCEHYATALALLLRAAGIPARVAAGYLGGEWSDVGRYLILRQSDAHAWTEAWIGGRWETLDATPPLGENSPFFARTGKLGIYIDWVRQRWSKYVVNYSLKMQAESVSKGWAALRRARAAVRRGLAPEGDFRRRGGWLAAALLPPLILAILFRRSRAGAASRKGRGAARVTGETRAPRPYARLLRRMSALGYRRSPGATMEEMLLRAASPTPGLSAAASRFLALYHRDRFGPFPLSPADFREAARLAERLRREIARSGAT
jgi:transglutaminase-like putative cysteine protease